MIAAFVHIQALPHGLRELVLEGTGIERLPDPLPDTLRVLNVSYCKRLRALPAVLPDSLRALHIQDCRRITELPAVPRYLTR